MTLSSDQHVQSHIGLLEDSTEGHIRTSRKMSLKSVVSVMSNAGRNEWLVRIEILVYGESGADRVDGGAMELRDLTELVPTQVCKGWDASSLCVLAS